MLGFDADYLVERRATPVPARFLRVSNIAAWLAVGACEVWLIDGVIEPRWSASIFAASYFLCFLIFRYVRVDLLKRQSWSDLSPEKAIADGAVGRVAVSRPIEDCEKKRIVRVLSSTFGGAIVVWLVVVVVFPASSRVADDVLTAALPLILSLNFLAAYRLHAGRIMPAASGVA